MATVLSVLSEQFFSPHPLEIFLQRKKRWYNLELIYYSLHVTGL